MIPEVCYLILKYLGPKAEREFVHSLANRELSVEELKRSDIERVVEILKQYESLKIGFVDAAVVATAERLRIRKILTTDRRHFASVIPLHTGSFELLP